MVRKKDDYTVSEQDTALYGALLMSVAAGEGDVFGYVNIKKKMHPSFRDIVVDYRDRIAKKNRHDSFIATDTPENIEVVHSHFSNPAWINHFSARFIPEHLVNVDADFYLWDGKVGVATFAKDKLRIDIFENPTIFLLYKQFFDVIWNVALEEPLFFGPRTSKETALERELYLKGDGIINLTASYPSGINPKWIEDYRSSASQALRDADSSELIAKIKKYFSNVFKTENIQLVQTATYALLIAIDHAIITPGDEVIMFEPGYDAYPNIVRSLGGNIVYAKRRKDFTPDIDDLRKKITKRTVAIVLTVPENPIGKVHTQKTIDEVAKLCDGKRLLILDSVFAQITPFGAKVPLLTEIKLPHKPSYMIIGDTGKILGLDGSKFACIAYSKGIEERLLHRIDNLFFQLNKYDLSLLSGILSDGRFGDYIKHLNETVAENYNYIKANIDPEIGLHPLEGSSVCMLDVSKTGMSDLDFAEKLKEDYGVAVIPVSYYFNFEAPGIHDNVRLALARPKADIVKAVSQINKLMEHNARVNK
ncbi:MAG: pyridoxal phosphate-dependent aminotransferase [Candidatus Micrarchaeales archaeon]|nr:pyridoxal phosphate-dependent aminotransferase [Candidatus Micrarchaeales archaeon]